jgi:integrase
MASIRRKENTPFWFACFTLPDGTRTQRSTGTSDRRKAERIANEYEDASRAAGEARYTEARARRTIADIYALANADALPSSSTADFLESWLKRKELEAGPKTHERYANAVAHFRDFLGSKAKRDISAITAADISRWRDEQAKRVKTGTVNTNLKIVRAAFAQARRDGLIDVNEAERVTILKRTDHFERRPFTMEELKRIIEAADDEWRGLILFGLYTGQRLGDLATLTWQNIDLQRGEVRLVTDKTRRRAIIPLAPPLLRYVETLPAGDQPDAPLFPRANATVERQGRTGNLSNQFHSLLATTGLAKKQSHHADANNQKGRATKREQHPLSFHSLRHTATSLLKSAGVSEAVAMEFIGHDSTAMSRQYTHIDTATLKQAAAKLPDVTK